MYLYSMITATWYVYPRGRTDITKSYDYEETATKNTFKSLFHQASLKIGSAVKLVTTISFFNLSAKVYLATTDII